MKRFLGRVVVNALAFWLTTVFFGLVSAEPGFTISPFAPGGAFEFVLTLLLIAVIFGVVNGVIGNFVRIVAFPIYVITLGLIALVVNALLLLLVSWISDQLGFGLHIVDFVTGVVGAIVLGFISWLLSIVLRPIVGSSRKR